jgi:hypothetical protein
MKNCMRLTLPLLILLTFLSSCNKNSSSKPPTTTVPPNDSTTIGTMKINLALPSGLNIANSELIISETSGKVLLDTVAAQGTTIVATLRTNAILVDLTYVAFQQIDSNRYSINTYKAVNPSSWTSLNGVSLTRPVTNTGNPAGASVLYTNVLYDPSSQFSAGVLGNLGFTFGGGTGTFSATYNQYPDSYIYLLLPDYRLYKLQAANAQKDTIDCTTMDTANAAMFSKPSYYSLSATSLYGWVDTTNVNSALDLYEYYVSPGSPVLPDVVYPRKNIQAFMLSASWNGPGANESMSVYSYGDSIPTSFNLPPPGSYNISSSQNTSFAMQFNTTKPSYCSISGASGSVFSKNVMFWTFLAPPDSSSLNPLGILTAQKSKLLQGLDLTTLLLNQFSCENAPGYDYLDYLGLLYKPNAAQPVYIPNTLRYSKRF